MYLALFLHFGSRIDEHKHGSDDIVCIYDISVYICGCIVWRQQKFMLTQYLCVKSWILCQYGELSCMY